MADISKITLLDSNTYNFKDVVARQTLPRATIDSTSTATVFTATIEGITELRDGVCCILFNNVIKSAANCTLNINNLGAKPIYLPTAAASRVSTHWSLNYTMMFMYNSTRVVDGCWDMFYLSDNNSTYAGYSFGIGYGTCATAAETTAKVVTLSNYVLATGGITAVKFTYEVPANATMNINSRGAKAIYYQGSPITAGIIKAGDVATFIYSTYYHLLTIDRWGSDLGGYTLGISVPSDAIFTDTKNTAGATNSSSKLFLIGATSQAADPQTYSHDTAYIGTDGCLYSNNIKVLTSHQDISGKLDADLKGAANGVAELDSTGKVPTTQLPSYVDDVLEYNSQSSFPTTGETGKIYVDTSTNKTYRWGGSTYVEISASLALGTTSSTAYRGDYGNTAYTHAVTNKGAAFSSGLYKITTNSEGHVTAATAVTKADITGLGIPSQDTTYTFDGTYNASSNKAATVSTVTNAINALDGGTIGTGGVGKTITSLSQTNGNVSATFSNISITKSQISDFPTSMTPSSHAHGNIQNGGTLQTTDIAIASGDKLIVTDSSDSSKIARTSVTFDGSTTTKALTQKGTWESFTNNAGTITGIKMNGSSKGTSGIVDLGTVITSHQDISGKADKSSTVTNVAYDSTNKKITKTINGTTSDVVTAATILGNLTKSQVTTALGYTPPSTDTNTHRPIQVNGTQILGDNTTALNFANGSNVSLINSNGTVTITATDTTYENKTAVASGSDISLVTTGEKYIWNNKLPNDGTAIKTSSIPFAIVDSTSTSTIFTATVEGITELRDGICCILMNNKVTSAANCTLNINNLGAKPLYVTSAAATRVTTQFAKDVTWGFIYNETRVSGGCWDLIYLYNTNTTYSTFSMLVRGQAGYLAKSVVYRYQLLFQIDDVYVTPLNNNSNATGTGKTMLTDVEFDPFGEITLYNSTTTVAANNRIGGAVCLFNGTLNLQYTFNCGTTLTAFAPFYLVVTPQSNGKVKIASTTPWAQALPTTNDGNYYIFLGRTYSNYQLVIYPIHPVYKYNGTYAEQIFPNTYSKTDIDNIFASIIID